MDISAVYINPYRYDYFYSRICIASVRYWYPDIPIYLIKDIGQGNFSTKKMEKLWSLKVFPTNRKNLGWGYGKMEAMFLTQPHSYLALDTDTVLAGPVFDQVKSIKAQIVVDDEIQPASDFNRLYYNLDRIKEIDNEFIYPGYSFNCGQYIATSGILKRSDFEIILDWTEPPTVKFPGIINNGDQSAFSFMIHYAQQKFALEVKRIKLMIWPAKNNADFIDLNEIKNKSGLYPYIIHWAGIKFDHLDEFPRHDILKFYEDFYYSRFSSLDRYLDKIYLKYLQFEKKIRAKLNKHFGKG